MLTELRLALVLVGLLVLPGWAMLALTHAWRHWAGLQRWCVAIGLSLACYPALFYGLRLSPLTLGPYKMGALLAACGAFVAWRMRGHWREMVSFGGMEWAAIGVFGMTLFTRFWIIRDQPYPAWGDSVHHTLLTQLTAVQGRLPQTMEPYFPIPLNMYHLGLYSLSASVQWLAQVEAHTALLWASQALNGLCGVGVYLVLDRKLGRAGALVGASVAGLLSHHPAWYVNWGRFTQVSAQAILLMAWLVSWEAISAWKRPWRTHKAEMVWYTAAAALLNSAVFLFHFRVAGYYLPLLAITVAWEWWQASRQRHLRPVLLGTVVVGLASLSLASPALWTALRMYVVNRVAQPLALTPAEAEQTLKNYYEFPWSVLPLLTMPTWLLYLSGLSVLAGLVRRNKLSLAVAAWAAALVLMGQAYLWLPLLAFSNLSGILIMAYLPAGLVIGAAVQELLALAGPRWCGSATRLVIGATLAAGFVASHARVSEIEAYRYFVTPADVAAMNWIKANTPPEARFAINTCFWLPQAPNGTDAGYWIPYFTGRQINTSVALLFDAASEYKASIIEMSRAAERLAIDNTALGDLRRLGIGYVYIGAKGNFCGPGLEAGRLSQAPGVTLVYQQDSVSIFRIE
ncbi:MAG: hypothetical protein JW850_07335 [Thermoflexales bacterium]|nr:hypothetical protein [Thermoflexales bacterium]